MVSLLHVHSDQVMSWNLLLCRKRPSFQNGFGLDQYQKRCGHHSRVDLPRADWHTVIHLTPTIIDEPTGSKSQFDDANLHSSSAKPSTSVARWGRSCAQGMVSTVRKQSPAATDLEGLARYN